MELAYKPDGENLKRFIKSNKFFSGLMGPVGSGKSVAGCIKILRHALEQEPSTLDGIRKTRWAVVRNTNPQLKTTTIKTWLDWFPEAVFGKFNWEVPYTHRIRFGDIDMEVIFLALDKPDDVRKLLSLELTGIFFNEGREIDKSIIDGGTMRCGRYPSMREGGPTWFGAFADTNAPEDDHWWPIMAGLVDPPEYMTKAERKLLVKPDNWVFFKQPPGMLEIKDGKKVVGYKENPKRENKKFQVPGYYENIITGKTQSWVDVYVLNKFGSTEQGKAVYKNFDRATHVLATPPDLYPDAEYFVGMDFGLTPAAIFGFRDSFTRYVIFKELIGIDMDILVFARLVRTTCVQLKNEYGIAIQKITGDPSGDSRKDVNPQTVYQLLAHGGVKAEPAPTNDPVIRVETVSNLLATSVGGEPMLMISPACTNLIRGFEGGYKYRRLKVTGEAQYENRPMKNKFSHPHDGLQYLLMGAGEGHNLLMADQVNRPAYKMQKKDNAIKRMSGMRKRRSRTRNHFNHIT